MSILTADGSLSDPFRQYIAQSRYARWVDDIGRRETWGETVDRYMTFMRDHLYTAFGYAIPTDLFLEVRAAILNHEVMPSMRAVMTAGPALERENLAGYNCAYLPIQDIRSFSEILYILMCGTGVGFSVERRYTDELPAVHAEILADPSVTIIVGDSKKGWATAFEQLLNLVWVRGVIPNIDDSAVREAGARLRTFGGRASGPEPLRELFDYAVDLLVNAGGRKLRPIEVHDLACKVASVVVVGGVRRSAMLSLSDLDDTEMAVAKSGDTWYNDPATKHRSLANNSAVYEGEITREAFDAEWASLVASGSGERGVVNRSALQRQAARWGRRADWVEYGVNPCSEVILRPYGLCNLTEVVLRPGETFNTLQRKVEIAAILGTWQSTLTSFDYVRPHWQSNAEIERLLGVSLTGIYGSPFLSGVHDWAGAILDELRFNARQANEEMAATLGINPSAGVTCVKPSGTVSSLTGVSAGLHPWHAKHYVRRVRADEKDPLAQLMIDSGVPHERDVNQPTNWVFSFPVKAPDGAKTRDDVNAIEHLNLWLQYQREWCEHKVSATVTVKEEEWAAVGEWVWHHLDEIAGVSFLPYDGGVYQQMPYETITAEEYEALAAAFPPIRWADLAFYESDDATTGAQELACAASGCDVL